MRYFVNIGSRDDFDWMQLKDFIKETLDLGRDDVFKVDVKEGFSFFNTDGEHTEKVMQVLNGFDMNGRRINVEISKNDGGSRNSGRRDHNGRSGGGGFRGSRDGGSRNFTKRDSSSGSGDRRRSSSSDAPKRERRSSAGESKGFFEKAKRSRRSE